jgi:hypothetical protein
MDFPHHKEEEGEAGSWGKTKKLVAAACYGCVVGRLPLLPSGKKYI